MRLHHRALLLALTIALPSAARAQSAPLAQAFRDNLRESNAHLVAAAEAMPAGKYGYKPTPAQRSFADILLHTAEANDYLCSLIGGGTMPQRAKLAATAGKPALIARVRESLASCDHALASLDDAKLGESLKYFSGPRTRAAVMLDAVADWESHYSQAAMYLRLNGITPPTAIPAKK